MNLLRASRRHHTRGFDHGAFDPSDIFPAEGAWLEVSDLSTVFQDAAGTIPVTMDGDPVGLIQDKSGNGNDFVQTVALDRPIWHTDGTVSWVQSSGGAGFLTFNGALNAFTYLHDGTGATTGISGYTNTLSGVPGFFGTRGASVGPGMYVRLRTSGNLIESLVSNDTQDINLLESANGSIVLNEPSWMQIKFKTRVGDDASLRLVGEVVDSNDSAAAPTSSDPQFPAQILAVANGANQSQNRLYALVTVGKLLTPGQASGLDQYLAGQAGVILP